MRLDSALVSKCVYMFLYAYGIFVGRCLLRLLTLHFLVSGEHEVKHTPDTSEESVTVSASRPQTPWPAAGHPTCLITLIKALGSS